MSCILAPGSISIGFADILLLFWYTLRWEPQPLECWDYGPCHHARLAVFAFNLLIYFKQLCVYGCAPQHGCGGLGISSRNRFSPPPCEAWGLDSGCQAWQQVLLPAEPSSWPAVTFIFRQGEKVKNLASLLCLTQIKLSHTYWLYVTNWLYHHSRGLEVSQDVARVSSRDPEALHWRWRLKPGPCASEGSALCWTVPWALTGSLF